MFDHCDFLLGKDKSIVIVLPAELPEAENFTVSISPKDIKFRAGYDQIAAINFENKEVFKRLSDTTEVGIVEYPNGQPFPNCITSVAYVEVRRVGL